MNKIFQRTIIVICVLIFPLGAVAKEIDYAIIEKNLKQYQQKVNALQQSIDVSIFNSEEILIKLDFDADNLLAFMQEKISFQAYPGLLRGALGTLNSRSGNSLDQSVLLAKLLNDTGLEARVAQGVLTEEQTKFLLSGLANAVLPSHIGEGQEYEKALAAFSKNQQSKPAPLDWQRSKTNARYSETYTLLKKLLNDNNISLEQSDITAQLIEQNKEYFWVQYRLSPTEEWKQAHPALAKGSKVDVKVLSHFKDTVPEKYLHQVKIEAFIQQRVGNSLKTHSLMKAWQKPAANLHNILITYSNAPSGANIKSNYNLEQILKDTNYFIPTFNGNAVGDKVFDLKGRLIDSEAMNSQAAALFKTIGDKTLSAIDKIENREDGESNMQLMAQWLQFTFTHPDGSEYIQKRYIYQAQGAASEMNAKIQLLSEYSILTNVGEQPLSYLANIYLEGIEAGLPLLNSSAKKLFHGEEKTAFPKSIPASEFDLLTQYYWMNNNPNLANQTIRFRATPNMLSFKKGFVDFDKAFFAVDIISNKQQFIKKHGDKYFQMKEEAFKQGIWDTASEWLPARFLKLDGTKVDTLKITSAAVNQDIELKIFEPNSIGRKSIRSIFVNNKIADSLVSDDINRDYLVIAPKQKPDELLMSGWWRINPVTGETLGMTADGGGSELTEYMIETAQTALSLVRALANLQKCEMDNSLNNFEKMCCMAEAHLNNVGGLSFGGFLGKSIGTAGAAVFDIADFASELATGTGIAPSTNGSICKAVGPIPDF